MTTDVVVINTKSKRDLHVKVYIYKGLHEKEPEKEISILDKKINRLREGLLIIGESSV